MPLFLGLTPGSTGVRPSTAVAGERTGRTTAGDWTGRVVSSGVDRVSQSSGVNRACQSSGGGRVLCGPLLCHHKQSCERETYFFITSSYRGVVTQSTFLEDPKNK
uniref:Uncharacterized protein n=1 Tax=Cacopsylla melanoneura TaxID=428564 RepID=A0A8D9BRH6_9HEMI